jgi:tRNA pseudouridine38-40 synthase
VKRYKLLIRYDGEKFYGWQIQKDRRTVQGVIENALSQVFKIKSRVIVHGAGRTDSGVHAYQQVAHFDFLTNLNENDLRNALNSKLEIDCKITSIKTVNNDFHARFSALRRQYLYQCYVGDSILYRNQSWILNKVKLRCLNSLAKEIIGIHDFLSFSKYNPRINDTKCKISESKWILNKDMVTFSIVSNRFLHHMIRYLVGTMIAVSENRFSKKSFNLLLENPRKSVRIFKAPAQGLILNRIDYV